MYDIIEMYQLIATSPETDKEITEPRILENMIFDKFIPTWNWNNHMMHMTET